MHIERVSNFTIETERKIIHKWFGHCSSNVFVLVLPFLKFSVLKAWSCRLPNVQILWIGKDSFNEELF